jgi:NifU-like protein involved in Fe-S cluster formation
MDEAVIQVYRKLLRQEFPNSGAIEAPSVFVEAVGEHLINCGNTGNYMQLYLRVDGQRILEMRYLCWCEPVANVAIEVICTLVTGMTLDEAAGMTEEPVFQFVGSRGEALSKKTRGLLALLREGIDQYYQKQGGDRATATPADEPGGKLTWDGMLST